MKQTVFQSTNSPYYKFIKEQSEHYYQASLLLPEEKHMVSWALFSFFYELNLFEFWSYSKGTDSYIHKWKSALIYGEEREVDLSTSLTAWLDIKDRFDINSRNLAIKLIKGFEASSAAIRFPSFQELEFYLKMMGGTISTIAANIIYNEEIQNGEGEFLEALSYLGAGVLWWKLLKSTNKLVNEGRLFVSLEDLKTFNCSEEDLLVRIDNHAVMDLTKFELQRALDFLFIAKKNLEIYPKGFKDAVKFLCNKYEEEIHSALRAKWLLSSPESPCKKTNKPSWFINSMFNLNGGLLKK